MSERNSFFFLFPVVAPTPKTSELKILSGPDFIYLDWPVPESGWASDFSIDIELMNSTLDDEFDVVNSTNVDGKKLADAYRSSIVPPFNVSDLIPEHQYKIVITTNLSDKWKTTLVLEDVFTTANNSKLPEEIIGVSFINHCLFS